MKHGKCAIDAAPSYGGAVARMFVPCKLNFLPITYSDAYMLLYLDNGNRYNKDVNGPCAHFMSATSPFAEDGCSSRV